MSVPALEAIELSKTFGSHAATKGVSLRLLPGARHALIGAEWRGERPRSCISCQA